MNILRTEELAVAIAGINVCRNLNLQMAPGQRWALLGRNGTGKTTLLHTLAGLRCAAHGTIFLGNNSISDLSARALAQQRAILLQQQDENFPGTVLETAVAGRHPHLKPWQWESAQDIGIARDWLQRLDLEHLSQRQIQTLSGGERQRLALATVMTQAPNLLLLDEPTNHLDVHQQISILELLKQWATTESRAWIATLHDINLATRYCDHALLLFGDGETLAGACGEVLTPDNLERLYLHPLQEINTPWGHGFLPR